MVDSQQTFGDLLKAKAILEADLTSAIETFMADPATPRFAIGEEYTADPHTSVSANPCALRCLVPGFAGAGRS